MHSVSILGCAGGLVTSAPMTGITGIFESSRKVVRYATDWTLDEIIDKVPNATCASILRTALARITPASEPLLCPQPITPDARPTLELRKSTDDAPDSSKLVSDVGASDSLPSWCAARDTLAWALLLPITSRGSSPKEFWMRVERTFEKLLWSVEEPQSERTSVYIAFDHNDPVLDTPEALQHLEVSSSAHVRVHAC